MVQVTPIERIRAEVEEVREEHSAITAWFLCKPRCSGCGALSPCDAYRLAEDKLRLAEVIHGVQEWMSEDGWCNCSVKPDDDCALCQMDSVIAEVAR